LAAALPDFFVVFFVVFRAAFFAGPAFLGALFLVVVFFAGGMRIPSCRRSDCGAGAPRI
jgi:hypothetical protein